MLKCDHIKRQITVLTSEYMGVVEKVDIFKVDTKIALYVDKKWVEF